MNKRPLDEILREVAWVLTLTVMVLSLYFYLESGDKVDLLIALASASILLVYQLNRRRKRRKNK